MRRVAGRLLMRLTRRVHLRASGAAGALVRPARVEPVRARGRVAGAGARLHEHGGGGGHVAHPASGGDVVPPRVGGGRARGQPRGPGLTCCAATPCTRAYVARWAEAEAWLERAIGIVDSMGDVRLAEECRALLTVVSCYQGKFARGLPLMAWLEHSARRRGALPDEHWALHYQAHIHLRLGDSAKARAALEQTLTWTEAQGGQTDRIIVEGTLALLRLREGDLEGARAAAEQALARMSAGKPVAHFVYFGVMTVAEVLLDAVGAAARMPRWW